MNTEELPMIIFTVLAQMSVGAFVVLGVVQVVAARRFGAAAVDKVTDPALYAIGPALVAGLAASMLHMNDVTNTLNVVRHLGTSWLSAEIVCGIAFAGLGFVFAAAQWFKWATPTWRRVLAAVTALVGIALVASMSMIYYTLVTVPAWHTWATPVQFFTTTFLLGTLAVGAALTGTVMWRTRHRTTADAHDAASAGATVPTTDLLASCLRGLGIAAVVLLGVEFLIIPLSITTLTATGGVAAESATVFTGAWFIARLTLVFAGAGLLAAFVLRYATTRTNPRTLAILTATAFVLVLASELIGRSLFYDSMTRIGM
ncbi:dimethyl sulfoxide reductase anchor subunit family protein [Pengzhenrongella sicca]|uniref:Dimethyl sulfoxide reductase anchor subunit n=1 Tax=Pengzhenrongella sicca TaxID=2819238 RepID=A0A8A4ZF07_9MICO|nr:DmsC/YnfH family molybdoenzyme membrane anchor subunit [Pengzhenrongella sicca]QTE29493.1 dimethyl sulfoxide reductase anchor subunit [Pengzhenrongella sicca]